MLRNFMRVDYGRPENVERVLDAESYETSVLLLGYPNFFRDIYAPVIELTYCGS